MAFKRIYCAGPLFNNKEKEEMEEIAECLEKNQFDVFLPQRDGIEFVNLFEGFRELDIPEEKIKSILNKAIFTLDVYQVLECDGLVLNINGRVPDEGAMVEAGIAWSTGKKVVVYKNDVRTLLNGNDNPLILGLSEFIIISEISNIPSMFKELFQKDVRINSKPIDNSNILNIHSRGSEIFSLVKNGVTQNQICARLCEILEGDNELLRLREISFC